MTQRVKAIAAALPAHEMAQTEVRTAAATDARARRVHFVDLLRLAASFQMVHGHTMDAIMAEELRHGVIFERWSWGRGLVSVAFLFAAGLSYHLSTLARFDQHRASRDKLVARFRRAGWLVVLGYLLHFPAGALSGSGAEATRALHELAMVDVLQCIGVCVITLEILVLLCRNARQVVAVSALLGTLAFALAPLGERLDPSGAWRPIVNYVSHQGGSLFPLLPWAGYVLAGIVAGQLVLPQGTRTPPGVPLPRLAACTAMVLALAFVADLVPLSFVDSLTSRNSEPAFNVLKLGVILAIVTVLAVIGQRIRRLPRFLEILSGESLVLYVVHLVVLYSAGIGLHHWIGPRVSLPFAIGAGLLNLVFMGLVGLGWHRVKAWRSGAMRG